MKAVTAAIARLSQGATTIAAAVEQEGSATREIAGQVNTVAQATTKAAHAMFDVSTAAEKSGKTSEAVLVSADHVTHISTTLREEVDHFLTAMRVTEDSENRRKYERIPGCDATASLRCDAHGTLSTKIIDISLGGAALSCGWPCQPGTQIALRFQLDGPEVPARVVFARNNKLAVAFRQDPETLDHVDRVIRRIAAQAEHLGQAFAA